MKNKSLLYSLLPLRYLNRWLVFFFDLCLSVCSSGLALLFVHLSLNTVFSESNVLIVLSLSVICSAGSFLLFQTYKGVIRHSTFTEAGRIGLATFFKATALFLLALFSTPITYKLLLLVGLIDVSITFFALIFLRVIIISIYNVLLNGMNTEDVKERLLILDNGSQTISLIGSSLTNIERNYSIAAFLNFDNRRALRIGKYDIYSVKSQDEFDRLVDRLKVSALLFPDHASVKKEGERLVRFCAKRKLRMLILPSVDEWTENGHINFKNLPEVRIEDLLNREEIKINLDEISSLLKDKVVLVTGAAGSIGSELCRQLCRFNLKLLILLDNAETPIHAVRLEFEEKFTDVSFRFVIGDVRNKERMENLFARYYPQVVFHAAAYKHVPLMEENPCEAVFSNVYGTMTIADLAVKYEVEQFVMISTDKAVNPTNVMGASKRMAEIYVQSLGMSIGRGQHEGITRFITTRFGNVLGSNGSVIPRFREQLQKGGPLTVTHPEIIRYFMTIPEACSLVIEAACIGERNEIFVFDMGEPVRIADLARRMIELAGMEPEVDIQIEYTGLRPGEKLFEELLAIKENTLPTSNEKIYRAQVREYDYHVILPLARTLCETAKHVDVMETVRQLKKLIPEFRSRQSKYECLDIPLERLSENGAHSTENGTINGEWLTVNG